MTEKSENRREVRLRTVLLALLAGVLFALLVCLVCYFDAGRPAGVLRSWQEDDAAEPVVLLEDIGQDKGFLRIAGAIPGMSTKPYRMRIGLMKDEKNDELILMHTQMIRRPDLAQQYQCDDHCGFAATLFLRNLSPGRWKVGIVFGAKGEENVRFTNEIVTIGEGI